MCFLLSIRVSRFVVFVVDFTCHVWRIILHFEMYTILLCWGKSGLISDWNLKPVLLVYPRSALSLWTLDMSRLNETGHKTTTMHNLNSQGTSISRLQGRAARWPSCFSEKSWWRHQMETFSALLALCAGNSPATGEFPAQRPVTRSFDVFFDLRLNERLSKQSWGWWFETPSRTLWRHCCV